MSDEASIEGLPVENTIENNSFPTLEQLAMLLPQYEFHDVLGVGGMGAVYLARQAALDRWVAIKLLPQSASQNPEDAARFITEARSMARLTHAHIAAVYDFGQTIMRQLYLVMEHVQGLDLHRLIHRDEVTPARIRSLVPQLCDALEYAHNHGVVHRDIKPANILITEDWQVKIVDFGLARDRNTSAVPAEVEYGTPEYVAPERLDPDASVDHRADIYALGVVIHEMFTKTTPMAAGPDALRGVPEAFVRVITRCTEQDPARRFQKCAEIKSFLAIADTAKTAAPIPAAHRPAPPPHLQAGAHLKRPQSTADFEAVESGGAAKWLWAAACVVLLSGGYWLMQKRSAATVVEKEAQAMSTEGQEGNKMQEPATTGSRPTASTETKTTKLDTRPATMPEAAAPSPPRLSKIISGGPFKPPSGDFAVISRLKGHVDGIYATTILADGRRVVAAGRDSTLRVWDAATGQELQKLNSPVHFPSEMCAAPTGSRLLISSKLSDAVAIFDLDDAKTVAEVKAPNKSLYNALWAPDGKSAYITCRDQQSGLFYWDPAKDGTLQKITTWPCGAYEVMPLPDSSTGEVKEILITGATLKPDSSSSSPSALVHDKVVAAVFSIGDHQKLRDLPAYTDSHSRIHMSPDATLVAGGQREYAVFDAQTMSKLRNIAPPQPDMINDNSVWADGGRLLLVSTSDSHLRIIEADTGAALASLHLGIRATCLSASKDGSWMVAAGLSMNRDASNPGDYDVLVIRLPDFSKYGSDAGFAACARRQLARLPVLDPELARLRDESSSAAAPGTLVTDTQIVAAVRDLTLKYGAALKRAAASASPKDQLAMNAEADAIATGKPVPDPATDSLTAGDHKRFRGIYRQQIAQLDERRKQGAASLRQKIEDGVRTLAAKRQAAGDRVGAARCAALLASLGEEKPFSSILAAAFTSPSQAKPLSAAVASGTDSLRSTNTPAPAAASTTSTAPTGTTRLQRTGKPGQLIKIERSTKNGYVGDTRSRVASIPPNLGPVLQVAASKYHALALLADGSLKGWGAWDSLGAAYTVPPEAQDAVAVCTAYNESAAVLATGSILVWNERNSRVWVPPSGFVIARLFPCSAFGFYALGTDGRLQFVSTFTPEPDRIPPSDVTDIVDVAGDSDTGWFAVKKDGSIIHWGKENIYLGQQHLSVKDALAVAVSDGILAVLHKDGTVDGWGQIEGRQRFRTRKYPGAVRIQPDPAERIFIVETAAAEWNVLTSPGAYEGHEEQRTGAMEGKLKGCTSTALSYTVVLAVQPR
jgi:serine/threonine protein kinase